MQILIRRAGTLIDVSPDGCSPLPREIVYLLSGHLVYQHKKLLRGADAFDPATGERQSMQIETRYLYTMEHGRLATGYGFLPKIHRLLQQAGHEVYFTDLSPPRERPKCYDTDWETVVRTFEFRARQVECLQAIVNNPGGVINACPGFGKTKLFEMLALLFPWARIHIVVKPKDVAARIVRGLSKYIPLVGQVGGSKRRMGRVTVFTADSLHLSDCDCDILLCDEAHMLMSEGHSQELGRYRISRNYALTATPDGRMDGAHARLEMFFGPEIFTLLYPEGVRLGLVVPITVRWLDINMRHNPAANKTGVSRERWGIWRNDERNQQIAADARTNYPADHQTLILVAKFDHAVHLWQHLPEYTLCYGERDDDDYANYEQARLLPQNFIPMSANRRNELRDEFAANRLKKVIATDVWSTGVDFEQLPTVYRVDARESANLDLQAPGRVSRIFEGKACGELVDCYDRFDKTFRGKSERRHGQYKRYEWDQSSWPVRRGRRQISGGPS
jgi:superfamily II DNA or RNA helicase